MRVIERDGVLNFTIEAVAREARASKPTIYKWWGNKHSLMAEAYRIAVPITPDRTDARDGLQGVLKSHFTNLWKIWATAHYADASKHLLSEAATCAIAAETYRDDYLRIRNAPILREIEKAQNEGELPASVKADLVVDLLVSFHLMRLVTNRPVDRGELDQSLNLILLGAKAL